MPRMNSTAALNADHPALAPLVAAGFEPQRIEQVLRFYDEPHRRYHDRRHLHEMFDAAVALGLPLSAPQAMAVLFHDAVYVPGAARGLNEALSAQLLRVYAGGLAARLVESAYGIVIDTAEHVARSGEARLVLDLDLMRLAAPREDFIRYSREVFAEQRPLILIDDDDGAWDFFAQRRVQFFERLLERPAIFCLPVFRERFEAITRSNLREAIDWVRAAGNRGMP
jgi:predicted metal-dependent HD superfamily phosphohydrolase